MSLLSQIPAFFARRKPQNAPAVSAGLRIVFHQDTRGFGQHGVIIATHVDHALNKEPVRFTFPGIHEAPALTPELIQYIWYKAEVQGFIVHSLAAYGTVMDSVKATKMADVLSQSRQDAESRFPAQCGQQLPPHVARHYGRQVGAMAESLMYEDATNGQQNVGIVAPVDHKVPVVHPPEVNSQNEHKTSVMA